MEKDMIFESFRNCVSDQKCKGCEWKACKVAQYRKVGIPLDLAFAVISLMADLLKEQEAVVRCEDCEMNNQCSIQFKFADPDDPEGWYCANGKRHEGS